MNETTNETQNAAVVNAPDDFEMESGEVSLRDYFAAQALGGVLDLMEDEAEDADDFGSFAFLAARRAFALADAMMIARDLDFEFEEEDEDEGEEDEEEESEGDDEEEEEEEKS